ncbi:unnamed protein product [Trifolium pratense]|uniref:Uncharacterized protein n=1 Tax=Trifolium pratense TaxID=57577 RepID=A0ACB0JMJ0_TRIPR|nr:unnamed protein product [Trifolium pratense]
MTFKLLMLFLQSTLMLSWSKMPLVRRLDEWQLVVASWSSYVYECVCFMLKLEHQLVQESDDDHLHNNSHFWIQKWFHELQCYKELVSD